MRQLIVKDGNEIFKLRSDERVSKFLTRPECKTLEEENDFINKINGGISKNEWIYWGITLPSRLGSLAETEKNDNKIIGTICLWNISKEHFRAEVGFELRPDFQGKGIMQEAFPPRRD
ncbi:MAG: GNAT family N-acetyltransferase [Ignavibacteria bacterium]|nr:GNAT family N-acetyltransferase [Ignavibacteria bacterium]